MQLIRPSDKSRGGSPISVRRPNQLTYSPVVGVYRVGDASI